MNFRALVHFTGQPSDPTVLLVQPDESRLSGSSELFYGSVETDGTRPYWVVFTPLHPVAASGPYRLEVQGRILADFTVTATSASSRYSAPPAPQVSELAIPAECATCELWRCDDWECSNHSLVVADVGMRPPAGRLWLLEGTRCPEGSICRLGPVAASAESTLATYAGDDNTAGEWCFAVRSIGAGGDPSPLSPETCITLAPPQRERCLPDGGIWRADAARTDAGPRGEDVGVDPSDLDGGVYRDGAGSGPDARTLDIIEPLEDGESCACISPRTNRTSGAALVLVTIAIAWRRIRSRR
jgi:hypothetical protein